RSAARAADRPGAGAGAGRMDRPRAAGRGGRHDCRRRHDSARLPRRRGGGQRRSAVRCDGNGKGSTFMKRIVLAYSGGLDTSLAIPWLAEKYGAEIICVTMDLGQGKELDDARERALSLGAVRAHVLDLRNEFARDFVL